MLIKSLQHFFNIQIVMMEESIYKKCSKESGDLKKKIKSNTKKSSDLTWNQRYMIIWIENVCKYLHDFFIECVYLLHIHFF